MCLIVDTNIASLVFIKTKKEFEKLRKSVISGQVKIVYGGELSREFQKMTDFRRLLVALDRQGAARQVDDRLVDQETEKVLAMNICRSDDPHVLALARVGRVRLICTKDQALREDVKDKRLLDKPRGNVYSSSSHSHLLRKHCPT
jgi:predicted nucleic acid-binding protein